MQLQVKIFKDRRQILQRIIIKNFIIDAKPNFVIVLGKPQQTEFNISDIIIIVADRITIFIPSTVINTLR